MDEQPLRCALCDEQAICHCIYCGIPVCGEDFTGHIERMPWHTLEKLLAYRQDLQANQKRARKPLSPAEEKNFAAWVKATFK